MEGDSYNHKAVTLIDEEPEAENAGIDWKKMKDKFFYKILKLFLNKVNFEKIMILKEPMKSASKAVKYMT